MDKWECIVCGYIYDPELGDTTQNITPGTIFEDLPDNWVCPICGAPKRMFRKIG
ncbi:MAG: rubredoxin [Candidatus Bathyarchaeota archaeon]|nr:rubredoxin [Candidatus Bathyarchaeota archaeon]